MGPWVAGVVLRLMSSYGLSFLMEQRHVYLFLHAVRIDCFADCVDVIVFILLYFFYHL